MVLEQSTTGPAGPRAEPGVYEKMFPDILCTALGDLLTSSTGSSRQPLAAEYPPGREVF